MKTFPKPASFAALASLAIIAGCAAGMPRTAGSPVEGQWMDAQGVSISTFSNGQFVTVATDTGNRVSEGTYSFRDGRTVDISMTSLVRQTQMSVNCAMVAANQLNCTNSQGQNFVLTRRS